MARWRRPRDRPADLWPGIRQGVALRDEYEATGNAALLDRSVEILHATAVAARSDAEALVAALGSLGLSLRARARINSGEASGQDLAAAVAAHEEAYRLVPRDSQHRAGNAGNLAGTLRQRWSATGKIADLDRSLELYREAIATVRPGSAYVADAYTNLANGLSDRFDARGDRRDLDDAVAAALAGVQATPPGSRALPRRLAIAAGLLRQHGALLGDRDEVAKAVRLATRARDLTSPEQPEYPDRLNTLSAALSNWYTMSGDLAALDQAVQASHEGLNRAHGRQVGSLLVNLSSACIHRYLVYEQPDDLQETLDAILAVLAGQETAPTMHRAVLLESSALLRRLLAEVNQDPAALAAATAALDEARAIVPSGSVDHTRLLLQLGDLKYERWKRWGADLATLDEAIPLVESALAGMQPTGTEWAFTCYLLSTALADRGVVTDRLDDLARAEQVLNDLAGRDLPGFDASLAAMVAKARGLVAAYQGHDAVAAEAFTTAIGLIREQFASQVTRRQRAGALAVGQELPTRAAASLIRAGRPADAVVALETGQAVLASEALARTTIDVARVTAVDKRLADRLRASIARLNQAEHADISDAASAWPDDRALRAARADFDVVLAQVRALPGLADVLAPPGLADVLAAARDRTLVYLTADEYHSHALVIPAAARADDIIVVDLPELTRDDLLRRLLQNSDVFSDHETDGSVQRLREFLDWLGHAAVQPWLDRLGSGRAAIRIVPTGWLALCPLHAATVRDASGSPPAPLLEQVTVSFAPNARAIALARQRAASRSRRRLLAVGDPEPTSAAPLPFARAEAEQVAAGYPDRTLLVGEQATLDRVRDLLPSADVVHLACHGYASPLHPEGSALVLSGDGRLTLGELMRSQVAARCVLLSACQTAVSGWSLPDEVVALPTSLLQAGAAGVIGSLWRVPDSAAAVLMVDVHERLRAGAEPAGALAGAQRWLRNVTNEELLTRWPALLSRGPATGPERELWLRGQPFGDPGNWAPFIFVGA